MSDPWMIQNTNDTKRVENNHINGNIEENSSHNANLQFEDDFAPPNVSTKQTAQVKVDNKNRNNSNDEHQHEALPDSENYLRGLERKLQKIKKGSNLVEALKEKRQDCLRTLLQQDASIENQSSTSSDNTNAIVELDEPISNSDSTVHEIYRHLQPIQALTVGETVHIVEHDQLETERLELERLEAQLKEDKEQLAAAPIDKETSTINEAADSEQ